MDELVKWAVSANVTGAVTWLGTIAGLIGIGFTFAQSRAAKNEARTAAQQASLAFQAVQEYEARLALSNLAYSSARIEMIVMAVQGGDFGAANAHVKALRRDMESVFALFDDEANLDARKGLSTLVTQLRNGARDAASCKIGMVEKASDGISAFLVKAEKRIILDAARKDRSHAVA